MKIIDTHAHYNSKQFNTDRDNLLTKLQESCEIIVNVGTNTSSFKNILKLAKKYDFLYMSSGSSVCQLVLCR